MAYADDDATRDPAPEGTRDPAPDVILHGVPLARKGAHTVSLGDFVVQRAIQQQLYFIAELAKNAHLGSWLAQFEGHGHLESTGRKPGAPGRPGTYSTQFGLLRKTPYTAYLSTLGDAPVETIQVEVPVPRRKLSAREQQNPFLVAKAAEDAANKQYMDVPIVPRHLMSRLLITAEPMADTWAFHLGELAADDVKRVAIDREPTKAMPTAEDLRDLELIAGGETRVSWYTEDEPLPLHEMDHRACDRMMTLRALESLIEEVAALTPESAFECDYLEPEDVAEDDGDDVDWRIVERRRKRKERRQAMFAPISEEDQPAVAREAAIMFLQEYAAYWVPKLTKGDERSSLEKHAVRPDPGMKERPRPEGSGADADAAFEDLWAWGGQVPPFHIRGGEFVLPARMGVRLRELRAVHAADAQRELKDEIGPELTRARITYTDWTEEDERLRLEQRQADAEAELIWRIDPSFQGLNEG